jgi:hypothetical protein
MFKLAEGRGSLNSLYCGPDGLYLGSAALIELRDATYFLRHEDDIAALLAAAYDPTPAFGILIPRLRAITDHLQRGELAQAMVAAVLLRLDDLSGAAIARVAQVDALLKHNFNPDEPRDSHGRWTDGTESDPPEIGISSSAQQHPPDERGAERPPDLTPISNRTISGIASWYDLPGHRMSNGQMFDPNAMNAAMRKVPLGTLVTVCLAGDSSRCIQVTVTDRGPYIPGRLIDLTKAAFTGLAGGIDMGLVKVVVTLP